MLPVRAAPEEDVALVVSRAFSEKSMKDVIQHVAGVYFKLVSAAGVPHTKSTDDFCCARAVILYLRA